MARAPIVSLFVPGVLFLLCANGCGANSEPPPRSPPPAPQPVSEAPSSKPTAPAPSGTEDAWEGEAEAKNGTAAAEGGKGGAETRTNEVIAKVIKDNRKPFRDCFEAAAKELGAPIEIVAFARLALGEGVEKQAGDFASEVAQLVDS